MSELTFRIASLDDLPQIIDIYNSTVASRMVTSDLQPITVASRQTWFLEHNPTKRPLWVVENTAKDMVGWASYSAYPSSRPAYDITAEISIYLAENQRGKGHGKAIMQYCLAAAPALGIRNVVALIFSHNQPSLNLFRQFGFEDWATIPNIAELDGMERGLSILGKRITSKDA